ncbi:MAG: PHP domain-containing protein [Candidatus Eisenbacteria bacterium]|nr:PHP domain-containing protein [Candidatus Eisenbacteria bacterium]
MSPSYVPLRIHTRFSPLLSAIEPEEAVEALARAGLGAAAVTDRSGLLGAVQATSFARERGIRLILGAEVEVRFPIPGERERMTAPYTLTLLAESAEGRDRLGRFLERLHREDRAPGFAGIARIDELAEAAGGWIVMTGGLSGPLSGAYAAGRVGEAHRAAGLLAERFDRSRLYLETSRTGSARESLVEPFLRRLESRYGTPRIAADPVRYLKEVDRNVLLRMRERFAGEEGEGRIDPLRVEGASHLPGSEEMSLRYADDPEPLRKTLEISERCLREWENVPWTGERGAERDEMIRVGLRELGRLFGKEPRWRRREAERRFWSELWRLEESGLLPAAVYLAEAFRTVRRSEPDAELHTSLLSGGLIGRLSGLQPAEMGGEEVLSSIDSFVSAEREARILVEADPKSALLLPGVLERRFPGGVLPALLPVTLAERLNESEAGKAIGPSEKGSGTNQKPPTRQPFDANNRGNPSPDPLFGGNKTTSANRFVVGFRRDRKTLVWVERGVDLWRFDPESRGAAEAVGIAVHASTLLGTLRESGSIPGNGADPLYLLRDGKWAGLFEGRSAAMAAGMRRFPPRSVSDLTVLLAAAGGNRQLTELFDRIVRIREGERQPPPLAAGLETILRETEGIPFYQEQLLQIIRSVSGGGWEEAEGLLRKMRAGNGADLAGDRSLFLRRAADRGASPARAARIFSILLGLAPHAARRADFEALAARIARAAARKSVDPVRFACASLNAAAWRRETLRERMASYRREGIRLLPLDRNRSVFAFLEEEGAVRIGLVAVPGMDGEKAARFERARDREGPFLSNADLLERLARDRFPREELLRLARAFQESGEKGGTLPVPARRPPDRGRSVVPRRESAAARRLAGRNGGVHGKRADSQTAFPFLDRAEGVGGRRRAAVPSSGEREVS